MREPNEDDWGQSEDEEWRAASSIFILVAVRGTAGERIAEIQRTFDPRLAIRTAPHLTLTGSSGVGPLPGSLSVDALRDALGPIAASTPRFAVTFGRPERFMQTNTVVLPIDPHGPIRRLHDAIARSGLPFAPAKFTFTPHVTLSYFATLTNEQMDRLLRTRMEEPMIVDHLQCSLAREPQRPTLLLELPLSAA
ncbi:MAG TPA: 2'-5' RNA ligase family protein [Gemmatimonadaceae bacterium]|nr:2'-5' RNA ligase family protein [Gemmatimonadaceae bacterium]